MKSRLRIIVTGLIGQHPTLGGVAWDYVQYAAGLLRLGQDVYYFEDSGEWPYNLDGGPNADDWVARDPSANLVHLNKVMSRFGLEKRWAYHFPLADSWHGLSEAKRREVLGTADLLINVSGSLEVPERYLGVKRRIYIDSDPMFTQAKLALRIEAFCRRAEAHHVHFTFGETLGKRAPKTPYTWVRTRQPILLDQWRAPQSRRRRTFSTVMSWTSYKPLLWEGNALGQKDVEFLRFALLPRRFPELQFNVAMSGADHTNWQTTLDDAPENVRELIQRCGSPKPADWLHDAGWNVVNPRMRCADLDTYRRFILHSGSEWSIAKNGYVRGDTGWFSCRSACYLAAGRPVIVQDTGFSAVLPTGEGIIPFRTEDEAAAGIEEVLANYTVHSRRAVEIAAEWFDASIVLPALIRNAFTTGSPGVPSQQFSEPQPLAIQQLHAGPADIPEAIACGCDQEVQPSTARRTVP